MLNLLAYLLNRLAIQTCCKLHGNKPGHLNELKSLLSFSVFKCHL